MDATDHHYDHFGPGARKKRLSLREAWQSLPLRATVVVVLLIVIVAGTGTAISTRAMNEVFLDNAFDRTEEWATALAGMASPALISGDSAALERIARQLVRERAVYVAFADTSGQVLALETSAPEVTERFIPGSGWMLEPRMLHQPRKFVDSDANLAMVDVVVPIYADRPVRDPARTTPVILGYLRLGADITEECQRLERVAARLLHVAIGLVLLVIPCGLLILRHVVSPLNELTHTARALAGGSMDARARVDVQGELAELAHSFNLMADRVTQFQLDLVHLNVELENRVAQRTRELEELAARDPLTALYNRRHFGEVITREYAAAERYGTELTCLMFDIDHFKETNDRFGHRTGDDILILLAEAIRAELRGADVAARFGGDEFIILMPQTAADAAIGLADRITRGFDQRVRKRFPQAPATLSVGVASLRGTGAASAEALIHHADVALYAAKSGGRNRMIDASELNPIS